MKKLFTVGLMSFFVVNASAQYYYGDILGTRQTNQQYKILIEKGVKEINATSYEPNDQPVNDFVLEQSINNKGQIVTRSASINSGQSYLTSTYTGGKLSKTVDSSVHAVNTTQYSYDSQGRITTIESASHDFDGTFTTTEKHLWTYNSQGLPQQMLKIKNGVDTTVVHFTVNENGQVTEERWVKNNRRLETYFYYYNDKDMVTDVVRFNRKAQQLLPDLVLEYNEEGKLVQMTQTQNASANYLIWRYTYNTNGLKEKEYVFNKQKELLGRVEYQYR